MSRPVPPKSRPRPPKSVPRPETSPARPPISKIPLRAPLLPRLVSIPVRLERAPAAPAVLAVLPDAPVRLDSALAGEETPDAASPETLPAAADDSPDPDADQGVAKFCRAWVTADISWVDDVRALAPTVCANPPAWAASPFGLVVSGGDENAETADAAAELAA